MYAIVETGGKQYRVKPGDTVAVERLSGEPGEPAAEAAPPARRRRPSSTIEEPTLAEEPTATEGSSSSEVITAASTEDMPPSAGESGPTPEEHTGSAEA